MMILMRLLCLVLAASLLPSLAQALELNGEETGRKVFVSLAEPLTLTLAGNPTTGYLWEVAAVDREILDPGSGPKFAPEGDRTGSGGTFTFHFTPRKAGTTVVTLVYRRPWEKEVRPTRSFDLTVTVLSPPARITEASYRSASGETLTASFDQGRQTVTVQLPEGRTVTLPAALSASGARYSDGTETFWEHQGIGRFFRGETVLFEGRVADTGAEPSQPRFRRFPAPELLRVVRVSADRNVAEEVRAPRGRYAFRYGRDNTVLVRTGRPKELRLSVPEFSHRPVEARWINAKLLYLEVWFNPHNGAYWIYDVERERVVRKELMDDGEAR